MWRASTCGFVVSYHWLNISLSVWKYLSPLRKNISLSVWKYLYKSRKNISYSWLVLGGGRYFFICLKIFSQSRKNISYAWLAVGVEKYFSICVKIFVSIEKEYFLCLVSSRCGERLPVGLWLVTTGHQQMWFHERSLWSKHNDVMMTGSRRRSRKKFINIKFRSIKLILRMVMILDFLVTCSFSREVPCYVRSWSKYICIYVLWEWKESSMRQGPLRMQNTYVSWIGNEKRLTLSFC